MKLATWNVNSLRVRLEQVLAWSADAAPTFLALQETKVADAAFPTQAFAETGWHVLYAGQPTYNGVALMSREPLELVGDALPDFDDTQRRILAASTGGLCLVNAYVPNGQTVGSDKYRYKLDWLAALTDFLRGLLKEHAELAIVGDFNIAPEDRDVHDPAAWEGSVLVSEAERKAFRALLGLGLVDSFRLFEQPEESYSWWDYRQAGFRRNRGLRIDHILMSPALAERCRAVHIDTVPRAWERPSDHTPVVAELD
ncbi:MAG: exodeoxyribonuclease III [Gammaproteobacteria bacterium]